MILRSTLSWKLARNIERVRLTGKVTYGIGQQENLKPIELFKRGLPESQTTVYLFKS